MEKARTIDGGDGHSYTVRRLGTGDVMRILRMGVALKDEDRFSMLSVMMSIDAIDGRPEPRAKDEETLIRLGDRVSDAMPRIAEACRDLNQPLTPEVQAETTALAKN